MEDTPTLPLFAGTKRNPTTKRVDLNGSRFVFTSAQNNTPVHPEFLASLKRFCKHNNAQLIVSPFTYNKNGFYIEDDGNLWYDPSIKDYFLNQPAQVSKNLMWAGELNILPTAASPLTGLKSYSRGNSMIVPHTKVQLESVPRMLGIGPCIIMTTGAVTQRNYIQKLAGQKAEFHHTFGAIYVGIDNKGDHFCRQLIAGEEGSFQDLTTLYTPTKLFSNRRIEGIQWGDIHAESINKAHLTAMYEMLAVLRPRYQFIHDILDFRTRNHHNIKDPYHLAEQLYAGRTVEKDISDCKVVLESLRRPFAETVVVQSNHDLALLKWLNTADVRFDPANAEYFHRLNAVVYGNIRRTGTPGNVLKHAYEHCTDTPPTQGGQLTWLSEDDSFIICASSTDTGIECANHGHNGPNGGRGSPMSSANMGIKLNEGHVHSPSIKNGAWRAGLVGKLDQGYNTGPTGWAPANIITYSTGKRAMVIMRGDRWRA